MPLDPAFARFRGDDDAGDAAAIRHAVIYAKRYRSIASVGPNIFAGELERIRVCCLIAKVTE